MKFYLGLSLILLGLIFSSSYKVAKEYLQPGYHQAEVLDTGATSSGDVVEDDLPVTPYLGVLWHKHLHVFISLFYDVVLTSKKAILQVIRANPPPSIC
jgi:hypothetical protein